MLAQTLLLCKTRRDGEKMNFKAKISDYFSKFENKIVKNFSNLFSFAWQINSQLDPQAILRNRHNPLTLDPLEYFIANTL